jgi:branched-chain amino acid transport system permease protein
MRFGRNLSWLLVIIVVFIIPLLIQSNTYFLSIFILCVINVLLASGLRTISVVGQLCFATMAFAGIGAYVSAILMMKAGLPIGVTLPLAGIVSMLVAALVAYPFVRVMGIYFAMLTLFFGEVIRLVLIQWKEMTSGATGLTNVPSIGTLSIAGANINFAEYLPYSYFALVVVIICLLFLYRIDRSRLGTAFASIEQDEAVASAVGINVIKNKILVFCIGCFFAGIAGSLYAHYLRVIVPDSFGLFPSIYIVIYLMTGGRKSFVGPIVGAIVLTLIPQIFSRLVQFMPFIYVAALYIVLYLMPGGLVDLPRIIMTGLPRLWGRKLQKEGASHD